jgi:hypothetical protein
VAILHKKSLGCKMHPLRSRGGILYGSKPPQPFTGWGFLLNITTPARVGFYSLSGFSQIPFGVTWLLPTHVRGRERVGGGTSLPPTAFHVSSLAAATKIFPAAAS